MGDLESTNHRSRHSHVKLVQDENRYDGTERCRVQADPDGMWLGQEQEQGARDGERQEQRKGQREFEEVG